jgi:tetratricopeptide (TPR) repeat protein
MPFLVSHLISDPHNVNSNMARKAPKLAVIRRLFALSGNECTFPDCSKRLIDEDDEFMGEVCHIEAAEPLGQRYNKLQNDEQRRSFENLILFCFEHHKKTDNIVKFPVEKLKEMKAAHERSFEARPYELPKLAEERIHEKLELLYELAVETRDSVLEIQENVRTLVAIHFESTNATGKLSGMTAEKIVADESKLYDKKLDFLRRLRKDRKAQTALEELKLMEAENWDDFDQELRYKVVVNIAVALLSLGRTDEAGQYLVKLEHVEFRNVDVLGFLALGYAITNNKAAFDGLAQDQREQLQGDSNFWLAYLNLHKAILSPEQIEEIIPESVRNTPEILFAIGEALVDAGNENKGFSKFDQALEALGEDISQRWNLQGVIATRKLLVVAPLEKIAFRAFVSSDKAEIQKLVDLLTESWEYIVGTEMAKPAWHILLNRGVAYRALDNSTAAEQDFEQAWQLANNFPSYKNLVLQYIDSGELEKGQKLIELKNVENLKDFSRLDYSMLAVRLGLATGDKDSVSLTLMDQLGKSTGDDRRWILDLVITGLFEQGAFEEAYPFIQSLIVEFAENPHGYLAMATYLRRVQKDEEANGFLEKTYQIMDEKQKPEWMWYLLSEEYYQIRNYDKAVECLAHVYKAGTDNDVARRFALAIFYKGDYAYAETVCHEIIGVSNNSVLAHEILFRIYENSGRNDDASNIIWQYLKIGKETALDHFRFLGIKFFHSLNDLDNVKKLISNVNDPYRFRLSHIFAIAQMHLIYGQASKGLDIAYEARIRNFESAKAHDLYVHLLMSGFGESIEVMYPEKVDDNTSVEVTDQVSKSITYLITEDERLIGSNILRRENALSRLLMGKKIGDVISIPNSVGLGSSLTVQKITSRHNHAFNESLFLLETKFSGHSRITFFHSKSGEGAKDLLALLKDRGTQRRKALESLFATYRADPLTVGMLADYLRSDTIDTWLELISDHSTGLVAHDVDRSEDSSWALTDNRPIVIETTVLITMFAVFGSADILKNLGRELHVTRATLDEIVAHRNKIEVLTQGREKEEAGTESASQNKSPKDWCDLIVNWCKENAVLQTPKKTISADNHTADLEDLIGTAPYHALELAQQIGGALLSDDARLNSLAQGEYNMKAFSTYQLMVHLLNVGAVSADQFNGLSKSLIRHNYVYIPISHQLLWELFEDTTFELKPPFVHAVRGLRKIDAQVAATIIVSFARDLYLHEFPFGTRDNTLQLIMREIKKRDDYRLLRKVILRIVDDMFRLLPIQRENFRSLILSI